MNYGLTTGEVITMFNDTFPGSDAEYNALKAIFAGLNEAEDGCPLGNCNNSGL